MSYAAKFSFSEVHTTLEQYVGTLAGTPVFVLNPVPTTMIRHSDWYKDLHDVDRIMANREHARWAYPELPEIDAQMHIAKRRVAKRKAALGLGGK